MEEWAVPLLRPGIWSSKVSRHYILRSCILAIDCDAVRCVELARLCSLFAKACQIISLIGKLLDSTADGIGPKVLVCIKTNSGRPLHILLLKSCEEAAKLTWRDLVVAPGLQESSFRIEFLHAAENALGGEEIARFVDGQKGGTGKERFWVWVAAKFSRLKTFLTPRSS